MSSTYDILPTVEGSYSIAESAEAVSNPESELLILEDTPVQDRILIILKQATPVILCFGIGIGSSFITQYFAGHLELNGTRQLCLLV